MKVNRKFLRSAERLSLSAIAKDSACERGKQCAERPQHYF